jgi:hypothetical protein
MIKIRDRQIGLLRLRRRQDLLNDLTIEAEAAWTALSDQWKHEAVQLLTPQQRRAHFESAIDWCMDVSVDQRNHIIMVAVLVVRGAQQGWSNAMLHDALRRIDGSFGGSEPAIDWFRISLDRTARRRNRYGERT